MQAFFILLFLLVNVTVKAQFSKQTVRHLQKGKQREDTSFVYQLPYKLGKRFLMVQGYYTKHSHRYMVANDFKMKKGSTICAARAGVVIDVKENSNRGGLGNQYLNDWNYIVIQHADSSTALYGHLKQNGALVTIGDTVKQGQAIALSGNTGYSAFPHLHFQVWNKNGEQIPIRFFTKKGTRYLKPLRRYKAVTKND
jgi:murein DD-endopeptidase MepM/ murein hydrolase activator NlpD